VQDEWFLAGRRNPAVSILSRRSRSERATPEPTNSWDSRLHHRAGCSIMVRRWLVAHASGFSGVWGADCRRPCSPHSEALDRSMPIVAAGAPPV
jgi:hypothetical protein